MSEQENESGYLVRDEPIEARYFDILSDTDLVTEEALRKAMDEAAKSVQSGTYHLTFDASKSTAALPMHANPLHTGWNPAMPAAATYVGDVSWLTGYPAGPGVSTNKPIQMQSSESQPSLTFKTDAELRAFVERCTAKYLDEKLDERVAKSLRDDPEIRAILTGAVDEHLDELAREFNENHALQRGVWRKKQETSEL